MNEIDLAQLRALAAVIDTGSFDAAAAALHVTPSAISQRIKSLENAAGQVLIRRGKPADATDAGARYLALARQVGLLLDDARNALDGSGASPTPIRLAINGDSLATWVLPALAELAGRVVFDIHREDQDHSAELLRAGTVVAAITSSAVPVQGCTVTRLGVMRYRPMASPAFVEHWFAGGATAAAFASAPMLVFDRKDDLQDAFLRERFATTSQPSLHPPRHYMPGASDFAQSIRLGMGWGMLPDLQSAEWERVGELVELLPDHGIDVELFWQQWGLDTPALRDVAEAIADAASRSLS